MKIKKIILKNGFMDWYYNIDVYYNLCLTGPNGSGKSIIMFMANALMELIVTKSPDAIVNLLWDGDEQKWRNIVDEFRIETDDGQYAYIRSAVVKFEPTFFYNINDAGEQELPKKTFENFSGIVPFLPEDRDSYSGELFAELLGYNDNRIPKDIVERLCKSILDKEAYPKYFTPMPMELSFENREPWLKALNKWLNDEFSHGEREIVRFAMAMSMAKETCGILFIDSIECGLHLLSQRQIINVFLPWLNENGIQLIYTTHSPECLISQEECYNLDEHRNTGV